MRRAGRARLYETFKDHLPALADPASGDLGQGFTPLVRSRVIGPAHGLSNVYFKLEHLNPTGSYKDRFAGLAVALARQSGARSCIATSSGNTGAALAAFGSAFGVVCSLFVGETAPAGKLVQMQALGARVFRVAGYCVDPAESARVSADLADLSRSLGLPFIVSAYRVCPQAMDGIKTIAYEIAAAIGMPDEVFVPAGGGGLCLATMRGFDDIAAGGRRVRLNVVQPALNDTIVTPLNEGRSAARSVTTTTTISGLAVAQDLDGSAIIRAYGPAGARGILVSDADILGAQARLARAEGILVEPAGATSIAGMIAAAQAGLLEPDRVIVCLLTGHGLKDPVSLGATAESNAASLIPRSEIGAVLREDRSRRPET
jgi:threonine synthase